MASPEDPLDHAPAPDASEPAAALDPAHDGWDADTDPDFIGLIGPLWRRNDGEGWSYAFLAESKHQNRRGVVHGGMLTAFADQALGFTAWHVNERQSQATVQLDVHFINAVRAGDFVEARCKVVRRTRSLLFMSAVLVVGSRVVATASGVWKVLGR